MLVLPVSRREGVPAEGVFAPNTPVPPVHQKLRTLVLRYPSSRLYSLRLCSKDGGRLLVAGALNGPTLIVSYDVLILTHGTHPPI